MHILEHLRTVNRHRHLVRKYCFRLGLYWQGLTHDLSKYSPTEFWRSAKYYQGYRSPNDQERLVNGVSLSWLHHKGRNRHHFEYWIDYCRGEDGTPFIGGCKMPVKYVAEMFCDRIAACRVYQKEKYTDASPYDYFQHSKGHLCRSEHGHGFIHPETSELLTRWLLLLKEQGEAAAKRVLMIGIPSGLQNAIFAVANLFVQIGVNSFDSVMVSGSSAAANADTLIFNMMSAFYTGCATFVSRNWGARKTDRILKSYRIVLLYSFLVGSICGGLLLLFGDKFLGLFANEADVIAAGMQRLKIMGFSFGVSALMDASIAASRGIGRSIIPTIIVIMGSCVFRVIWVYTVFAYFGTIPSLFLLYIFSWAITGIAEWAYFRHSYKKYILHGQIW